MATPGDGGNCTGSTERVPMKIPNKCGDSTDMEVRSLAESIGRLATAIAGRPRPVVTAKSWLSPGELADLVGKSGSTVRRWIRNHGLPAKQIGSGYLIRYRDFVSWAPEGDGASVRVEAARILKKLG